MGITRKELIQIKGWRFIQKECGLVRGLIGSGINELGKASYKDNEWHYYNAFFGLSIGIERLAKLILVADHIITKNGTLPDEATIKSYKQKYGHDLISLLTAVEGIAEERGLELEFPCPRSNDISMIIVCCLNSFANASEGRYFNFNILWDARVKEEDEPIGKWWREVAELILKNRCCFKEFESAAKHRAAVTSKDTNKNTDLYYMNEIGEIMSPAKRSVHDEKTSLVQVVTQFYTLIVVRWLADVFIKLSNIIQGNEDFRILFEHSKHFKGFSVSDDKLMNTESWPVDVDHENIR